MWSLPQHSKRQTDRQTNRLTNSSNRYRHTETVKQTDIQYNNTTLLSLCREICLYSCDRYPHIQTDRQTDRRTDSCSHDLNIDSHAQWDANNCITRPAITEHSQHAVMASSLQPTLQSAIKPVQSKPIPANVSVP